MSVASVFLNKAIFEARPWTIYSFSYTVRRMLPVPRLACAVAVAHVAAPRADHGASRVPHPTHLRISFRSVTARCPSDRHRHLNSLCDLSRVPQSEHLRASGMLTNTSKWFQGQADSPSL
jgi:hypothetical protein